VDSVIVDAGSSHKHGAYLPDKSDSSTIAAFDTFQAKAESLTGKKIRRLWTDRAYESVAWEDYCRQHSITHEFTAPYSSAQNGLAERAIRTTMDDVQTILCDSDLGHSYWAEAAAYSIDTRNLVPSRRHPDKVPLELFTGKRQSVSHLRVFGARCWAKIPTVNGVQITGGSKLDVRDIECRLLGYASGNGNYKIQDVVSCRVFTSHDVVFEEGEPNRTSPIVGDRTSLFDVLNEEDTLGEGGQKSTTSGKSNVPDDDNKGNASARGTSSMGMDPDNSNRFASAEDTSFTRMDGHSDPINTSVNTPILRRSTRISQPSSAIIESQDYQQREAMSRCEGQDWATGQQHPHASLALDC